MKSQFVDSDSKTLPPGEPKKETDTEQYKRLEEELRLEEQRKTLMYELPHLHGWGWYPWALEFFKSTNKMNFLCAANQISKSSTQIRKCIEWATNKNLWPQLWRKTPKQFWYLYPAQDVVNLEFELKWSEFLPRGAMKDDPYYGWEVIKKSGDVKGIKFNSGLLLVFKTYSQETVKLQTGTVDALFCDEELPEHHYHELSMRLNDTSGYFHMVFTATLGQDIWRLTMEPTEHEIERFPHAAKWTVSLYDAMKYVDGTPSHIDHQYILDVKAKCATHADVLRRVYGRFVLSEGRQFPSFDATKHLKKKHDIPHDWHIYGAADIGSGGTGGHPAAIVFVAVRPDYRAGRVFCGWRGDDVITTSGDIVEKFLAMKKENKLHTVSQYYDWGAKDFETIAGRMNVTFLRADKSYDKGVDLINTLFKNDMLIIYDGPELAKLAGELSTLRIGQDKKKAKDDLADALRYAISSVPWDFSGIVGVASDLTEVPEITLTPMEQEIEDRRRQFTEGIDHEVQDEFNEWNDAYGT